MSASSLANIISEASGLHFHLTSIIDQYEGRYAMMRTIIRFIYNEDTSGWSMYRETEQPFGLVIGLKRCEISPFCSPGIIKCTKCMFQPIFRSKYLPGRYYPVSDEKWARVEEQRINEEGECTFLDAPTLGNRGRYMCTKGIWVNDTHLGFKEIWFPDMSFEELIGHIVNGSLSWTHPLMTPNLSDYIEKEISLAHLDLCLSSRE